MNRHNTILSIIVFAQFCCTSLWFAGNAIISELIIKFDLMPTALGHLTSAVQFGFIIGTLIFAILSIADRFSPSKVFFFCSLLGAIFNLGLLLPDNSFFTLLIWRFLVGFFLAGIYPVGMKIAADYFNKGLGKSLGFLVGALVLGTALPHLINGLEAGLSEIVVVITTSILSVVGGVFIVLFVSDGPFRKRQTHLNIRLLPKLFEKRSFKVASFGYFGHMWELYTFWAFIPFILTSKMHDLEVFNYSIASFAIIAIGSLGCIISGQLSSKFGERKIAFGSLILSSLCCLVFPIMYVHASSTVFMAYLLFWGLVVIADSPLFSTLVAQTANPQYKGTALTIINCIGFSITIISIQFITLLTDLIDMKYIFMLLAIGPLIGISYYFFGKSYR